MYPQHTHVLHLSTFVVFFFFNHALMWNLTAVKITKKIKEKKGGKLHEPLSPTPHPQLI